uniref:CheW protein n=1 Tax=Geobacter sp. (strain M21) TaxID=443144 RepID=C6E096_GEOSM
MIPQRLILFTLGGEEFACSLLQIGEVMEPQRSYPFAGAPAHYLGLINFHGNLTALVDLALYLGLKSRPLPGKLLVLDPRLAHLALKVDGVSAIIASDLVTGEEPGDDPLTEAYLETPRGRVRLLQLEALIGGLEDGLRQPTPHMQS